MIIHKFIIHVLDKNSDTPILNDFEGRVSQDIEAFFQKKISKVSRDNDIRTAVFNDYSNNLIKKCCEQIIYDESSFLNNSKEIAAYLFDVMKLNAILESCDLAICLYSQKDEKKVAILKLDYNNSYTHSISFEDDKFNIQMSKNEINIQETKTVKIAALVGLSGMNDEYHLKVLDKDAEKEEANSKFVTEFLNATRVKDDKYRTKKFKDTVENWITNVLGNDIKQAEDIRSILNYTLKEKHEIDIKDFVDKSIKDDELKNSFKEHMEEKGLDESFSIDKKWVEKKLKKRNIKTDNGFEIKGNLTDFEDPMKYTVRQNQNGSIDIIIKNVNSIMKNKGATMENKDNFVLNKLGPASKVMKKVEIDEKEIKSYLKELKECEEVKVFIIRKDGIEIPIVFKDGNMNEWLRKEIEISFDRFKDEIAQVKKALIKVTGEN
ncbi:37-kD nucleoid-associated bacterial family protein [Clostridioides difficile DA00310]|nr:nucleoid-associated protein [Clostridioides difficile]EQE56606.1 37-kD nucleoid-associated bacterial family protein [Clostridioides difficile CD42]EQF29391.1 37-kD nucleoid-associated bacterial family protein [Clostridioides difficile CD159]EQF33553.1 37-kD nucleoid-associated bacterial family protein [Clostridioides difficile CD165]EQG08223.1 37-kD nucleoid-associated bacterial family protein [Clostridioides difficile DA00044]EQG67258.1 37-kD nucleoid-associated bacterial family protein [C